MQRVEGSGTLNKSVWPMVQPLANISGDSQMIEEYKSLRDFLASYFNQDWNADYPNENAIIKDFKENNSQDFINQVHNDIDSLLSNVPESIVNAEHFLLYQFSCYFWPPSAGMKNSEWLAWLRNEFQYFSTDIGRSPHIKFTGQGPLKG